MFSFAVLLFSGRNLISCKIFVFILIMHILLLLTQNDAEFSRHFVKRLLVLESKRGKFAKKCIRHTPSLINK